VLKLTVDVFSGRPNPAWPVDEATAREVLPRLAEHAAAAAPTGVQAPANLGFRGLLLEPLDEAMRAEWGLGDELRLAAPGAGSGELELAERLLLSAPEPQEPDVDHAFLLAQLGEAASAPAPPAGGALVVEGRFPPDPDDAGLLGPDEEGFDPAGAAQCGHESYAFDAGFWNGASHLRRNNCYNFATAQRTDTFAQPGRAAGAPLTPEGCATRTQGARRDGAHKHPDCAPAAGAPRHLTALVIWPGVDYHWYRLCANGLWGHKPGQTEARQYDNVGAPLRNPYTCSRTPYSTFCGWFYAPRTMRVR
jgi:hypothetical protein